METKPKTSIISAQLIEERPKAWLLDCEGDKEWFPKSTCSYDSVNKTVEAPNTLLKQKFPSEQW